MDKLIKKLLRESLNEMQSQGLSPDEQLILDDLVSVNEAIDINSLLQKFKKHAKAGAITIGIVISLLSNDALAQQQKQQILNTAQTVLSADEIKQVNNVLKSKTGLEFNDTYAKNNFEVMDKDNTPGLPSGDEIKALIIKDGLPSKYLDNVYIDYINDAQGNNAAGVKISVRLKEEGNFKRLDNSNKMKIVAKKVFNVVKQKEFKDGKGVDLVVSLEIIKPNGSMFGNKAFKI